MLMQTRYGLKYHALYDYTYLAVGTVYCVVRRRMCGGFWHDGLGIRRLPPHKQCCIRRVRVKQVSEIVVDNVSNTLCPAVHDILSLAKQLPWLPITGWIWYGIQSL